jgi:hypothetical protein
VVVRESIFGPDFDPAVHPGADNTAWDAKLAPNFASQYIRIGEWGLPIVVDFGLERFARR